MDLGLRDLGVENDPRRHAAHLGTTLVQLVAVFLSLSAIAVSAAGIGAAWIAFLLLPVAILVVARRTATRAPLTVVKIGAEGTSHFAWLLIAPVLLFVLAAVVARDPLLLPIALLTGIPVVMIARARGRIPEVLRKLGALRAADESVLGDGVGVVPGARGWNNACRLVAATDRRLLVVPSARSTDDFPLVDAPCERVSRFGIEWKRWGRVGELSLEVAGDDGAPPETHVITSMAPANMVSIAQALSSHGVQADDPAAVADAERAWAETRRRGEARPRRDESRERWGGPRARIPGRGRGRMLDFDRGLWMLLRLSAGALYVNSFGVGLGPGRDAGVALLVLPVVCGVCGYVAGTKRSIAYLIPLNLLVSPAFFFTDAGDVIALMLTLSALAALGLVAGSALGRARRERRAAAEPEPEPQQRPARGSLQEVLSGPGLIRLSGVVLAGIMTLVVVTAAAGLELTMVRLGIEELVRKQVPVDGRSNLTGNAASLTYTRGPDLRELITDHAPEDNPTDGARWELRSSFTKGFNVVSLASYTYDPPLGDAEAVARFVAKKDGEHSQLAGSQVTHTTRVVDGRKGWVWNHGSLSGYWYYAAWFPHPVHTVRVECIARRQEHRFRRLCAEAVESLEFR